MIQASKAKQACLAGAYDKLFEEIYQGAVPVCEQRARYAEAMDQYIRRYGDTKRYTAHRGVRKSAETIRIISTAVYWRLR